VLKLDHIISCSNSVRCLSYPHMHSCCLNFVGVKLAKMLGLGLPCNVNFSYFLNCVFLGTRTVILVLVKIAGLGCVQSGRRTADPDWGYSRAVVRTIWGTPEAEQRVLWGRGGVWRLGGSPTHIVARGHWSSQKEIRPEMLKALDIAGLSWLTRLFSVAWRSGTVPVECSPLSKASYTLCDFCDLISVRHGTNNLGYDHQFDACTLCDGRRATNLNRSYVGRRRRGSGEGASSASSLNVIKRHRLPWQQR